MSKTNPGPSYGAVDEVAKTVNNVETHVIDDVRKLQRAHQNDTNFPENKIEALDEAVKTGDTEKATTLDDAFTKASPYEAVQGAVRESDGEVIANTVRAWVLGFLFVTVAATINMFLSMRSPVGTPLHRVS